MKCHHVYFIYNSLGIAISLHNNDSYYHTFDASYHNHQTSVPFVESDTHVSFNDDSTFIFAWGSGKSDKRVWMEERGFQCEGRVTQRQITDFFNTLSVYDKADMINRGLYVMVEQQTNE